VSKAIKHDSEKPMMYLLSPYALEEMAKVLTYGAKKYSPYNWKENGGLQYSRVLSATLRHLNAYQKGERKDNETGLSHLAHAACGLMMLIEYEQTSQGIDDLFKHEE
jgi:hypothetical protein